MLETLSLLQNTDFPALVRDRLTTLQVNLGYKCNQQCLHCHVNAGPNRTEVMSRDTIDLLLEYLEKSGARTLDVTGGAPEMNPHFRYLVEQSCKLNVTVIDRCNLTILEEQADEGLAEFMAKHKVEISASLPCYMEDNVDAQRGKGVYRDSIKSLQRLNRLGYGKPDSGLILNLVYNPVGPHLPPPQQALEADYKKQLSEQHGIVFNQLFTITNMPIKRFGSTLVSKNQFSGYMDLLRGAYQAENLPGVMCRNLISIDWQGYIYDCDFNQMLELPAAVSVKPKTHISDIMEKDLTGESIVVMDHCYGCTAGQGSSCGGALA